MSPEYAADPASVPVARRFVRSTLGGWGAVGVDDDAALLTTELATNAVLHASGSRSYRVTIDLFDDRVRVGVIDRSTAVPRPRHYGPMSGTGRGLALVASLATAWGVVREDGGKCVWFELSLAPPDAADAVAAAVAATLAGDVDLEAVLHELGWDDDAPDTPRALLTVG